MSLNMTKSTVVAPSDFYIEIESITDVAGREIDLASASFYFEFFSSAVYDKIYSGKDYDPTIDVYVVSYDGETRVNNAYADGVLRFTFEDYNFKKGTLCYKQVESYSNDHFDAGNENIVTIMKSEVTIKNIGRNDVAKESNIVAKITLGALRGLYFEDLYESVSDEQSGAIGQRVYLKNEDEMVAPVTTTDAVFDSLTKASLVDILDKKLTQGNFKPSAIYTPMCAMSSGSAPAISIDPSTLATTFNGSIWDTSSTPFATLVETSSAVTTDYLSVGGVNNYSIHYLIALKESKKVMLVNIFPTSAFDNLIETYGVDDLVLLGSGVMANNFRNFSVKVPVAIGEDLTLYPSSMNVPVKQTTGSSTELSMSQQAITAALAQKIGAEDLAQETGTSAQATMSQDAVTKALAKKFTQGNFKPSAIYTPMCAMTSGTIPAISIDPDTKAVTFKGSIWDTSTSPYATIIESSANVITDYATDGNGSDYFIHYLLAIKSAKKVVLVQMYPNSIFNNLVNTYGLDDMVLLGSGIPKYGYKNFSVKVAVAVGDDIILSPSNKSTALKQSIGTSTEETMSQNAISNELAAVRASIEAERAKPIKLVSQPYIGNLEYANIGDADYNQIILYGQSLALGWESPEVITSDAVEGNYMVGTMPNIYGDNDEPAGLNPLMSIQYNNLGEQPIVGCVNAFSKLYRRHKDKSQKFIGSSAGEGGKSIEQLSKECTNGENYYTTRFLNLLEATQTIVEAEQKSVNCSAIIYMQGESNYVSLSGNGLTPDSDATSNKDSYKDYLMTLKNNMQADVMAQYGQSEHPLFFIYEVAGGYIDNNSMSINMAQVEFAQENEDVFLLNPTYFTSDYNGGHLSSNGYRWYGESIAKSLYEVFVLDRECSAIMPTELYVKNSTDVEIAFSSESELVVDTYTTAAVADYGFEIYLDGEKQTITSVEVVNNVVRLFTGVNLVGEVEVIYAGQGSSGAGNIRNSRNCTSMYSYFDDRVTSPDKSETYTPVDQEGEYIYGERYPLYDWVGNFYYKL